MRPLPVRPFRGRLGGLVAVCLVSLGLAQPARAGLFDVNSSYTANGTNFPTTFSQSVAVSSSPTPINGGQLTVAATVFATGPNAEWVDFNFQRVGGGPLAGNLNGSWGIDLDNLMMTQSTSLDGIYIYWTVNGVAVSPINPFSGIGGVAPNPINPALGPAYVGSFAPFNFGTTLNDIFTNVSPYSFISAGGMNPNQVNGFHIGIHLIANNPTAVPEPGSLSLLAVGMVGAAGFRAVRRRKG